jgi:hypothetical protein
LCQRLALSEVLTLSWGLEILWLGLLRVSRGLGFFSLGYLGAWWWGWHGYADFSLTPFTTLARLRLGLGSFGLFSLGLLLALSLNGLPDFVVDQLPQSHLLFSTGKFIDTHRGLLFFYLSAMLIT